MRVTEFRLRNFLSYRDAILDLGNLTALVGPNAAGKSNAVAAIRLLRDIPRFGLQAAIARRGGFDQLRHRSEGRPYDPSVEVRFQATSNEPVSHYGLHLGAKKGKRYEVKLEEGETFEGHQHATFTHRQGTVTAARLETTVPAIIPEVSTGQSALPQLAWFMPSCWEMLQGLQPVDIDPARVGELQEPSSPVDFEPDGSNAASFFESLTAERRADLVDQLAAVVPGIQKIEPRIVADKLTLTFFQEVAGKTRTFSAKQMSDGTLRAFGILASMFQEKRPSLLVIEEPERAIHLGALRTLVEILREHSRNVQILITTHSADMIDALDVDDLRVVWMDRGASKIARVAEHTRKPVREGLITPGELLRSDALDPAVP